MLQRKLTIGERDRIAVGVPKIVKDERQKGQSGRSRHPSPSFRSQSEPHALLSASLIMGAEAEDCNPISLP